MSEREPKERARGVWKALQQVAKETVLGIGGLREALLVPFLAMSSALIIGALFILISEPEVINAYSNLFQDPGRALQATWKSVSTAYGALFQGSIGNPSDLYRGFSALVETGDTTLLREAAYPLSESLTNSVPYIFAGLAVALGFRCGLFNIGAEGQILIGGLASVWVGYTITGFPWFIHLPLALVAGTLAGTLWSAIAGYLKARTGAHEVINTIMMNYLAFRLSDLLLTDPRLMGRPTGTPMTPQIVASAYLPRLFGPPLRFHAGFFLALLAAVFVFWFLWKTTLGFEIRTVGANPDAARYAGMNVAKNFVLAMGLSGALAGLAGANEVLGVTHFVGGGFSPGYGFDSIALALLGKSHPVGVVLAALLFGTLRAGASKMQILGIPIDIIQILQATIIMFIAAPALVRLIYRIRAEREIEVVFTRGWGG